MKKLFFSLLVLCFMTLPVYGQWWIPDSSDDLENTSSVAGDTVSDALDTYFKSIRYWSCWKRYHYVLEQWSGWTPCQHNLKAYEWEGRLWVAAEESDPISIRIKHLQIWRRTNCAGLHLRQRTTKIMLFKMRLIRAWISIMNFLQLVQQNFSNTNKKRPFLI